MIPFGILKISGLDAKKFLQGQLTCDVEHLSPRQLAAHCNPQGRIISLFRIIQQENDYYLLMPRAMIPIAIAAFKKYSVFFKVSLMDVSDDMALFTTLRLSEVDWQAQNMQEGVPTLYPETSEKFLPHELNLEQSDAISFNKGCYTGQEIIARMHYRGKLKTHLYKAKLTTTKPPTPGASLYYQAGDTAAEGATIVDSCPAHSEYNCYQLLVVCDEQHAIDNHLYLDQQNQFITFMK